MTLTCKYITALPRIMITVNCKTKQISLEGALVLTLPTIHADSPHLLANLGFVSTEVADFNVAQIEISY